MIEHFKLLGLTPTKNIKDIKSAYRKLALKFHPDVSKDSGEMFKRINYSYEFIIKNINSYQEPVLTPVPDKIFNKFFVNVMLKQLMSGVFWGRISIPYELLKEETHVFIDWQQVMRFKIVIPKGTFSTKLLFNVEGRDIELEINRPRETNNAALGRYF